MKRRLRRKLIVRWNLPRLAADLAVHLEALKHADQLLNTSRQSEEFLQPYGLSPEDEHTVLGIAWKKYCRDCGRLWDQYMVYDAVWAQARLGRWDWCCRECLSRRLGRRLEPSDFTPCPLNLENGLGDPRLVAESQKAREAFRIWLDEEWRREQEAGSLTPDSRSA